MKLFPFFKKKSDKLTYRCSCCGKIYENLPLTFGSDFPEYYFSIPINEREERIELEESLCVIDKQHFFHRGRLIIPIIDYDEDLIFNVWTTISSENFEKRMDLWENPDRINEEPYFGWLQTIVPTYGETLNIKSIAIEQEIGIIPEIKSIEESHSLTFDQEHGITYEKAIKIVDEIMKQQHCKN